MEGEHKLAPELVFSHLAEVAEEVEAPLQVAVEGVPSSSDVFPTEGLEA